MANQHGDFIWYELMTPDASAAMTFYRAVVGWDYDGDANYRQIKAGDGEYVGGMLQLTAAMQSNGAHPIWIGYILVDDVDVSVASIVGEGGKELMAARDMEGVGRLAMVADPQGAPFYIMRPTPPADNPEGASTAFDENQPKFGHGSWNELATSDPEAAKSFYTTQFGWSKDGEMDMGPIGKYEFLKASGGRFSLGGLMTKMPEMPVSMWNFYFRVPHIDVAVATIKAMGGSILQEPGEIPGGEFSMNGMDPQGAAFALVGPR